jgi:hypothetical protein
MNYIDGTIVKHILPQKFNDLNNVSLNYLTDISNNIQTQINDIIQNGSGENIYYFNNNQTLDPKSQLTLFTITSNKTVTLPDISLSNGKKITIINSFNSSGNLTISTTNNQTINYSGTLPIVIEPSKNIILLSNGTSWYATQYSSSGGSGGSGVTETVYTYTTSQTLNAEQQIAIFNLSTTSTVQLPTPSSSNNLRITIINTFNSSGKLTVLGDYINSTNGNSIVLLPAQNIVLYSNGTNWFTTSNQTNSYSILKTSRNINSYLNDISNNL